MSDFWASAVANLIGSLGGVGAALFFDRRAERNRRKAERAERRHELEETEASELRTIQWLVEDNEELARQIRDGLGTWFYFRMNTHLFEPTIAGLAAHCDDPELVWKIQDFRFQLEHLNNKLAAYFDTPSTPYRDRTMDISIRNSLQSSIKQHLDDVILPDAAALLPPLRDRQQRLTGRALRPIRPPLRRQR